MGQLTNRALSYETRIRGSRHQAPSLVGFKVVVSFTPVLPFEVGAADFIGDYNAIAAADGRAYPFYQDARFGIQDVYVTVIPALNLIFGDGFESGDTLAWGAN